ncbi:MAG TPA: inorganic phosphate transporter, partial [Planctomycetota bacterium]|nr:inorganic phosphate transporter [Planctomycetota bacterium]
TANAVATVIYTHTLKPWVSVIWSGVWNLIGVLTSSGAVAFGILALLPVELVVNVGSSAGFAMVFALLISAILWNLGTWYLGLPASSSHTLIGSIMGVGLANSMMTKGAEFGEGVNWAKAREVFLSLLISPVVGFMAAGLLLIVMRTLIRRKELFTEPPKGQPPPMWIRGLLILTCTGVSFAHGSNDGQKGMGLVLLILIGILPASYALNMSTDAAKLHEIVADSKSAQAILDRSAPAMALSDADESLALSAYLKTSGKVEPRTHAALAAMNHRLTDAMSGKTSFADLAEGDRKLLRTNVYLVAETIGKLNKQKLLGEDADKKVLLAYKGHLDTTTKFVPPWVKVAIALALGLGTMIGWKRIVVTVGEKIGKTHLTYAQGASAELVAMTTIGAADVFGLPVSTTHVLSSGVAGTMAANRSGLQMSTLRNLLLAWVLTLPVCVILGAGIFAGTLNIIFYQAWWQVAGVLAVLAIAVVLLVRKSRGKTSGPVATAASSV